MPSNAGERQPLQPKEGSDDPTANDPSSRPSNRLVAFVQMFGIMFLRCPIWTRIWLVFLMGTNLVSFGFLGTIEGQITGALIFAIGTTMSSLYQQCGFSRILGLSHVYWLRLVPWIFFKRLPLAEEGSFFKMWLQALVVMNSVSLLLDIKDVYEYFVLGKKEPTAEW